MNFIPYFCYFCVTLQYIYTIGIYMNVYCLQAMLYIHSLAIPTDSNWDVLHLYIDYVYDNTVETQWKCVLFNLTHFYRFQSSLLHTPTPHVWLRRKHFYARIMRLLDRRLISVLLSHWLVSGFRIYCTTRIFRTPYYYIVFLFLSEKPWESKNADCC